jgi:branched-chain amino acid transport system ATP-binding protein
MGGLRVTGLAVGYGATRVLEAVALEVRAGELVALIGGNGAGKTTLLETVAGTRRPWAGRITLDDEEIGGRPSWWVARRGVTLVPEGRGIFGDQTVRDNLLLGALARRDRDDSATAVAADLDRGLALFPMLGARLSHPAGSLSGGQQQMLAVSKAVMLEPELLLIDELSLGLAPLVVQELLEVVEGLRSTGVTMVIVEQSVNVALAIADRAVFMERGRVRFEGPASDLLERDDLLRAVFLSGEGA